MNKLNCKCLKFAPYISWQIDSENDFVYILNIKNDEWIFLNNISKDIWILFSEKKEINEIVNKLSLEYEIKESILEEDIIEFLNSLLLEGLVVKNECL